MIRRLRIRLIVISMLSLLLVLLLIVGGINALNYRALVLRAEDVLSMLERGGGRFPEAPSAMPDMPRDAAGHRHPSPELPFETRFFSVLMDGEGAVLSIDTDRIAAVSEDEAVQYARSVQEAGRAGGFMGKYRFRMCTAEDGVRIIFVDCGHMLTGARDTLLISIGLSLAGLLAVLLMVVLLSRRIVRPFSESYEKQKRFIADAGHELKTPLTIINADAELIEMELGASEWLDDIRAQTARMTELTGGLMSLARMEDVASAPHIEFPLSDLISDTAASFIAPATACGKRIEADIQPMLSMTGDQHAISQLVGILLDNAIKYSTDGCTISLRLARQGRFIAITVSNPARDISPAMLHSMFERFYRGDPSRSSQVPGYGIGLSMAQAIVRAHKGRIWVESTDGRSLMVCIHIPA